jgi:hypothetical protein
MFPPKYSYCTRLVDFQKSKLDYELPDSHSPSLGDVGLFKVLSIGKHRMVQCVDGINRTITPDDCFFGVFGNRYASAQIEGYVPDAPGRKHEILGQGGLIGKAVSFHSAYRRRGATKVELLAYAIQEGGRVANTYTFVNGHAPISSANRPKVILSLGARMDSGKTTSAAHMVRGLKMSGRSVAYVKLTGSAHSNDRRFAFDMGADHSVDFSDLGVPSTFLLGIEDLLRIYSTLLGGLSPMPEFAVVEIADGILQRETALLLSQPEFVASVSHAVFSCCDSLSALAGLAQLKLWGITPFAISGPISCSPLLIKELGEQVEVPVLTKKDLSSGAWVEPLENSQVPCPPEVAPRAILTAEPLDKIAL